VETRPGILKKNFDTDYDTLIIAFAGWADPRYPNGQPFPFVKTFKDKKVKFISIKDLDQCFYMNNLYDGDANILSNGIVEHVEILKKIIKESKCKNVATIGVSTGGFASILFGVLLGVKNVVAFDPQTFIRPIKNYQSGSGFLLSDVQDHNDKINKLNLKDADIYGNLCKIDYSNFSGKIQIHTGASRRDRGYKIHLAHENEYKDLKIYKYDCGIHAQVAHDLKVNGKLNEIANELIL